MSVTPNQSKGGNKGHDNLRPAKKGEVRNPHGRPKKALCIPDMLRAIGDEPVPAHLLATLQADWGPDFRPRNMRDAALRVSYAQYAKGDKDARQFVVDRTEGKVTDKLQLEDVTPNRIIFEEVLVDGKVTENKIVRTITRPNASSN